MVLATEQGVDGVVALTIGMATYNDFNGVYFTLQALRLYQDLRDTELLVIDNFGCPATKQLVEGWVHGARYVLATEVRGTAAAKDRVFREAHGEAVLCCDSHVLLAPGTVRRLKEYYREHPECPDLLQGPLVYDDLQTISTHFEPVWRGEMWGIWQTDPRGQDPEGEPFEIPMQGMGLFSCRKDAWPGFNPMFRGFGWEEGYIHEKVRRAGGRCLCLPWLRWTHRFGRLAGIEYPLTVEEKLRNYVIGHAELGWDLTPVLNHFSEILPKDHVVAVAAEALEGPPKAPEPAAATPQEVDAGAAGGGATAPATLTEGADQVLQSPLLGRLPSPLLALLLIVFGPKRIGQMVRGVERFAYGARNSVEEARVLQGVEDRSRGEVVKQAPHQPEERAPGAASEAIGRATSKVAFIYPIIRTDFIERSIDTLTEYTEKGTYRIIIVDQSLEGIKQNLVDYLYENDHLYIRQKNQGYSNAANKGIIQALQGQTPYIAVVNDDTEFMYYGWFEDAIEEFDSDPKIVAVNPDSPRFSMAGYGRPHGDNLDIIPYKEKYTPEDIAYLKAGNYDKEEIQSRTPYEIPETFPFTRRGVMDGITTWLTIFKREALMELGLFEERFVWGGGEDYDMNARAYSCGYPVPRDDCDPTLHRRMVSTMKSWVWHHWGKSKDSKFELDPELFKHKEPWNNLEELWAPTFDLLGHYTDESGVIRPIKRKLPVLIEKG
jgi:GT2 family glycosyltransferase/Sec-independent protein translocase protein TatA